MDFVELRPRKEAITGRQSGMTVTDLDELMGSKFLLIDKIHLWFKIYHTGESMCRQMTTKGEGYLQH